jgi:hypothetical protein
MNQVQAGDVLAEVFRIYRAHAAPLLLAALVVFAIPALLALLLEDELAFLVSLVSFVLSIFYQGMVVQLVRDVQDGRLDSSMGELFRSVTPVLLPLVVVSILFGLAIGIGFALLIVPGLFLLTIWAVAAPVTVIERPGILSAFGRSRELVRGHGWQVLGAILLVFLVLIGVSIVVGLLALGLTDAGEAVLQWLLNAATAPVSALTASVLYFALRRARGESAGESAATI